MLKLKLQYLATWCEEPTHWKKKRVAGKDWKQEDKRAAEEEMSDSITNSMNMNLSKLQEITEDLEILHASVHGVAKSRTQLSDWPITVQFSSVQSLSRAWLFVTPWNHSMPGLPVHHQLPEFTQTHVHRVSDAIQPSRPLSSPSPPALNLSQHQGLFKWVSSSHQVGKGLEFQLQHQSFQWTPRTDLL